MTGLITLSDGGQNYIEFDVECNIIQAVRPSGLAGWKGTKILNQAIKIGDVLLIDLQWDDYDLPLVHTIANIAELEIPGSEWLKAQMPAEPGLYANAQTEVEHMAYEVYCGEIPLYFDCLNTAAVAAANALLSTDKIPSVLLELIDGVQLIDEPAPWDENVVANLVEHFMTIFGGRVIDAGIMAHEATHSWAVAKWESTTPPPDTDYIAAINSGEPAITEYGKTSPGEDLAEAVRYYVMDPTLLKTTCPLRYSIVDKLMTDPRYYG